MARSKKQKTTGTPSSNKFPVVGVGASAGGLEAFKRLIRAIPESSGMAFILVQHLEPNHESLLPSILQKVTNIPVEEITDNVHVEPDHIYIIPANRLLTADDGVLRLNPRPKDKLNMPIDLFFTSLAEVHGSHAIGIVLSGTHSDGTQGLKAIKASGGTTFAQEQESAAFVGMPKSAIAAGVVDFILPPEEMPLQLAISTKLPDLETNPDAGDAKTDQEEAFRQLLILLRLRKGTDFTYYKQTTIRRRIARRMGLNNLSTIPAYLTYFKENPAEQDLLYQDLLIPVTGFFRDPVTYDVIRESILPGLLDGRNKDLPLRIWVAGCSTGQETYSMAICLEEYLQQINSSASVQIFATDVSERSIAVARKGIYSAAEVAALSPERLEKYFEKAGGNYHVSKAIRQICVFAHHNFLKSPPFARMDLISCRNVLIYMEPFLQKKALATFHYSLKEDGYLVLGHSETTAPASELFQPFDRKEKIYTRKTVASKFLPVSAGRAEYTVLDSEKPFKKEPGRDDFQKSADNVLLSRFSPPGVVVNDQLDIVEFRGSTNGWLQPGPGKPSFNVLKLTSDGLTFELRNALYKARSSNQQQIIERIPVTASGQQQWVTLEVHPLPNTSEPYFLILFRDSTEIIPGPGPALEPPGPRAPNNGHAGYEQLRTEQLEKELAALREDMRRFMEEQEAAIEELQSANEELLSGSEELQSLNEELETSKEEIQSTNEELTTLNQELYDRNEQLNSSRLYAESIIATIREPLLVLDSTMHVKTANKAFYEKFDLLEDEIEGRSVYSLGKGEWDVPALRAALAKVLSREANVRDIAVRYSVNGTNERLLILNAARIFRKDDAEQLILLAMEDVTEARKREDEQKAFANELKRQVEERTASLKEANIALKSSNENLEQFATIASHDLQEPLRKIRTFAAILNQRHQNNINDDARELIQKINLSAERMAALIQDVLDFSKVLDASFFENIDLTVILQSIIRDFDLQIEEKGAVVHYEPLPVVHAVPLQMNQLFYNLVSNALKFSKPGTPPVIDISSRTLPADEITRNPHLDSRLRYCEIIVADQGIGIDPRFTERIFLIFQRLNTRQHFEGTGVGLALCKRIVSNHNGDIFVSSNNNNGTRFHVLLPLPQE